MKKKESIIHFETPYDLIRTDNVLLSSIVLSSHLIQQSKLIMGRTQWKYREASYHHKEENFHSDWLQHNTGFF